MPVASKESLDMAEQMITKSNEIDRLKFRVDRLEKIVVSLEKTVSDILNENVREPYNPEAAEK